MKKIKYIILALAGMIAFGSCDKFLDELPDDRAELNSVEKVKSFLVSAYPQNDPAFILEFGTDNVADNGKAYSYNANQLRHYRWEVAEEDANDSPKYVWNGHYTAVASANEALEALESMEETSLTKGLKAEALLCRAFAMFRLATTFCMAWDPTKGEEYLGLPYPKMAGVSVNERGTLAQLYANIDADIEAALPLLNDTYLDIPKYHFNSKAAYAFAARFNLFYLNDEKAIRYASVVLGPNPSGLTRKMQGYLTLAGVDDFKNTYVKDETNLLLLPGYSIMGRTAGSSTYMRFNHKREIVTNETYWATAPWGTGSSNNVLVYAKKLFGNNQTIYTPKLREFFEITDKVSQTGYPHIVNTCFTYDETLMVRAEAYARTGQFDLAVADLNTWVNGSCSEKAGTAVRPVLTVESINQFMDSRPEVPAIVLTDKQMGIKKPLHPQGFAVEEGTMTNLIHLILHVRRLERWWQGDRFLDIKRYGIEISHIFEGEDPLAFTAGDLRGAIQLPSDVISAGLAENPR